MGDLAGLIGHELPGGRFRFEAYEDWMMRDVVHADREWSPELHPLSIFAALQRSMGMTLAEFFRLCGAEADEGPMLGDTGIDILTPVLIDHEYSVRATVTDAQRKVGKKAGTIDIVHLTVECSESDGGPVVARLVNSYIFRRAAAS
jgi:hypothetical protein